MPEPTIKPDHATTYHRDGTVSLWDVHRQQWIRTNTPPDAAIAACPLEEQRRIIRHCGLEHITRVDAIFHEDTYRGLRRVYCSHRRRSAEAEAEAAFGPGVRTIDPSHHVAAEGPIVGYVVTTRGMMRAVQRHTHVVIGGEATPVAPQRPRRRYTVTDSDGVEHRVQNARDEADAMRRIEGAVSAREGWHRAREEQVVVRVSSDLVSDVDARAEAEGISRSDAIRAALKAWAGSAS